MSDVRNEGPKLRRLLSGSISDEERDKSLIKALATICDSLSGLEIKVDRILAKTRG